MRRFRLPLLILTAMLLLLSFSGLAAGDSSITLSEKEWTWEKKNIASFEGTATTDSLPEGKLLLKLSLTTEPKATDPGEIVFQTVNGKKLTLKKQKDEFVFNHENQEPLTFIGNWRTPDDVFFSSVEITFRICTEDGETVLAEQKMKVSRTAAEMAEKDDGKIRLKADFSAWTLWIGIAAGVIWLLAIIRIAINHRTGKKEG